MPYDRPTQQELLDAVTHFIQEQLLPELDGSLKFKARVANNVLKILTRELQQQEPFIAAENQRLQSLLKHSGNNESLNRMLAGKIRAGEFNLETPGLFDHLWQTTLDKLAVDNPGYSTFRHYQDPDSP